MAKAPSPEDLQPLGNAPGGLMQTNESFCMYGWTTQSFIPKVDGASDPCKFRPISMSSIICRLYHKIIANRLDCYNNYVSQMGFKGFDGVAFSVFLLDFIIKESRRNIKNLSITFDDVSKAFDSVSLFFGGGGVFVG